MTDPVIDRRPSGWPQRINPAAAAAVVVALSLAAYLPSLPAPFFFADDYQYVTANSVLQGIPLTQSWRIFTSRTNPWEYLPVRDLSYRVDMAIFGLNATGFRVHNLVLYALCCLAVWPATLAILRALRPAPAGQERHHSRADKWFAAGVTVLFAAHPAHVESVAWIAGRKDLLSGLLAVGSLWLLAEGLSGRRHPWRWWGGSYVLFALAVLSKSTVMPVAAVAFLLALAGARRREPLRRALGRAALVAAPLLVMAAGSVAIQVFGSETYAPGVMATAAGATGPAARLSLAARILGTLARIALAPVRLRLIYDLQHPTWAAVLAGALGWLTAAAAAVGAWLAVRQRSLTGMGLATLGLLLAPFLQIIPFITWSLASERFLFLPVLGLAIAVVAVLRPHRSPARAAVVVIAALAGAVGTLGRSTQWASSTALVTSNARLSPSQATAVRLYIHYVLLKEGRFAEARIVAEDVADADERTFLLEYVRMKEAFAARDLQTVRDLSRRLLRAAPREDYPLRIDITNMVMEAGQLAEAEDAFGEILREAPGFVEVRYNLGLTLARRGRHEEAVGQILSAIEGGHATATAWNNLALAYKNSHHPRQAQAAFRQALLADPRHWHAAYNLARLLLAQGDRDGARSALDAARARAQAGGDSTRPIDDLMRSLDGKE